MPESNGWKILKLLKSDINLRHIPIHLISGEDNKVMAMKSGAKSFNLKPLSNNSLDDLISGIVRFHEQVKKKVLVIEDNEGELMHLSELLINDAIEVYGGSHRQERLSRYLKKEAFDCIILDFVLPDANGLDLLNKINSVETSANHYYPAFGQRLYAG